MQIDPQVAVPQAIYKLLIGYVVPRPIAWVSSLSEDGFPNLAPFSFFMAVCNDPPTLAFSSGRRAGNKKDTVRNIEYTQDFVVNLVDDALAEQVLPKGDRAPKALACYGLLRVVDGRPVSHVTTAFLAWLCQRLAAERKRALVLLWDNPSWHISREVRMWLRAHNQQVKRQGGVRLLTWRLPIKSPWLNSIEPHWVHGKRAIVEPARLLSAAEIITRVGEYFRCEHVEHFTQHVA